MLLLLVSVYQVQSGTVDTGLIVGAAGLGINPELRSRMRLKLFLDKGSKTNE
ncbi:MAG: hypothetical protein WCD18_24520 [Thermosynechococcaceae cyanobacterium]